MAGADLACITSVGRLDLPSPTNLAPIIFPAASVTNSSLPPTALIQYLDTLSTVREQLSGTPVGSSCDPIVGGTMTLPQGTNAPVVYLTTVPYLYVETITHHVSVNSPNVTTTPVGISPVPMTRTNLSLSGTITPDMETSVAPTASGRSAGLTTQESMATKASSSLKSQSPQVTELPSASWLTSSVLVSVGLPSGSVATEGPTLSTVKFDSRLSTFGQHSNTPGETLDLPSLQSSQTIRGPSLSPFESATSTTSASASTLSQGLDSNREESTFMASSTSKGAQDTQVTEMLTETRVYASASVHSVVTLLLSPTTQVVEADKPLFTQIQQHSMIKSGNLTISSLTSKSLAPSRSAASQLDHLHSTR